MTMTILTAYLVMFGGIALGIVVGEAIVQFIDFVRRT